MRAKKEVINMQIDAPVYFGGVEHSLWFMDNKINHEQDNFDDKIMDALITRGIGERICPTEGCWTQFCIISAVMALKTGNSLILTPTEIFSQSSSEEVEKYSWDRLWREFRDYGRRRNDGSFYELSSKQLVGSLLRMFIPRHHYGDGLDRPYNQSHFVTRWGSPFVFPDYLGDKTCNVRLRHLKRGREIMKTFSPELSSHVIPICKFIPPILNEVNGILDK